MWCNSRNNRSSPFLCHRKEYVSRLETDDDFVFFFQVSWKRLKFRWYEGMRFVFAPKSMNFDAERTFHFDLFWEDASNGDWSYTGVEIKFPGKMVSEIQSSCHHGLTGTKCVGGAIWVLGDYQTPCLFLPFSSRLHCSVRLAYCIRKIRYEISWPQNKAGQP